MSNAATTGLPFGSNRNVTCATQAVAIEPPRLSASKRSDTASIAPASGSVALVFHRSRIIQVRGPLQLMGERLFGASVRRREDERLTTGRGRYVADVALPGMLHVAVYRSPHAHARLARIDADGARKHRGVVHVVVPNDVAQLGRLPL